MESSLTISLKAHFGIFQPRTSFPAWLIRKKNWHWSIIELEECSLKLWNRLKVILWGHCKPSIYIHPTACLCHWCCYFKCHSTLWKGPYKDIFKNVSTLGLISSPLWLAVVIHVKMVTADPIYCGCMKFVIQLHIKPVLIYISSVANVLSHPSAKGSMSGW